MRLYENSASQKSVQVQWVHCAIFKSASVGSYSSSVSPWTIVEIFVWLTNLRTGIPSMHTKLHLLAESSCWFVSTCILFNFDPYLIELSLAFLEFYVSFQQIDEKLTNRKTSTCVQLRVQIVYNVWYLQQTHSCSDDSCDIMFSHLSFV